ncbi:S1 family peptidase [Comamonas sp. MYb396]|uniref:S1 family peptidase n=1 Tax=Comamonas sp. MYb396 TaxID=2745302 RepID=UPI00309CA8FC
MRKSVLFSTAALFASAAIAQQSVIDDAFTTRAGALKAAGLENAESPENKAIVESATSNYEILRENLGDSFGGFWVEYDENGNAYQVLAATTPVTVAKGYSENNRLEVVSVKYSFSELIKIRQQIQSSYEEQYRNGKSDFELISLYEGIKSNVVVVKALPEYKEAILLWLQKNAIPLDAVDFQEQDGQSTLMATIYGGQAIYSAASGIASTAIRCTSGFNVTIDTVITGAVTAGHCETVYPDVARNKAYLNVSPTPGSSTVGGGYIGDFLANQFGNGIDAVLYGNWGNVHTMLPKLKTSVNTYGSVKPVIPVDYSRIGQSVCHYGNATNWRCGTLSAVNSTEYFNGRPFNVARATFCGGQGDSGGPVVHGVSRNAMGIYMGVTVAGATNTCGASLGGSASKESIFQPLKPYLDIYTNVKIMTE